MKIAYSTACLLVLLTAGCATQSQNVYDFKEAGQSTIVEFGTVLKVRPIAITGQNTGTGAVTGGVAGATAGSALGGGDGRAYGAIGGLLAGATAGAVTEHALANRKGLEYTILTEKGKVITVPQYVAHDEPIYQKGARIMLQTSGSYQRVLNAEDMPTTVQRPKGIQVID